MSGSHSHCELCVLWSSSDPMVKLITTYISENVCKVGIQEICEQTRVSLEEHCDVKVTKCEVFSHITELVELSKVAKNSCYLECEETDKSTIDTKALGMYLKTVNQITNIYKMENYKNHMRKET